LDAVTEAEVGRTPLAIRTSHSFHDRVAKIATTVGGVGVSLQKFGQGAYAFWIWVWEDMDWKGSKAYSEKFDLLSLCRARSSLFKQGYPQDKLDALDAVIVDADDFLNKKKPED
jgi:hypothetical protein